MKSHDISKMRTIFVNIYLIGKREKVMTKEQRFFLDIIADHLCGRTTVPLGDVDWSQIIQYSKSHQLEGLVYHQLRAFFAGKQKYENIAKQMETVKISCIHFYVSNVHAYNEIKNAFQLEKIRFFSVKGLEVAAFYPIPAYRTMGDLDIVVFPEDREKASAILKKIGYHLYVNDYVLHYKNGYINLELHDHLLYKRTLENEIRKQFFNTCWNYVNMGTKNETHLDNSFHYLFLVEHTKKHFRATGIGFRQFIDLAVFAQKCPDLEWNWIKQQLHKIDLWKFAVTAHTFIKMWWGIESPFEVEEVDELFFEEGTNYIFNSGVFGFDNRDYLIYAAETRMSLKKHPKVFLPFVVFLRKVFLSYDELTKVPYCSFVIGRKWLYPIGVLYRIVYVIFNRKERIDNHYKVLFGSQTIMDRHRKLMGKWGV